MRWFFRGVLALDRAMRLFPSLIQVWLVEFIMILLLAFFAARVVVTRGGFGCPPEGTQLDGTFWGALVLALLAGIFFVRNLLRPKVREVTWTPMVNTGLGIGGVTMLAPNVAATVRYEFLSSHPAYALLHLMTVWLPLVMVLMTSGDGCNTHYWRIAGYAGLGLIGLIALLRVLAWYVFRFGRTGGVPARLDWQMAWKPTLSLVFVIYLIIGAPMGVMFLQDALSAK